MALWQLMHLGTWEHDVRLYIYVYKYIYDSQIVHHNHSCFNLFILHNNTFGNQGSELNENDIFFTFRHTDFYKNFLFTTFL